MQSEVEQREGEGGNCVDRHKYVSKVPPRPKRMHHSGKRRERKKEIEGGRKRERSIIVLNTNSIYRISSNSSRPRIIAEAAHALREIVAALE